MISVVTPWRILVCERPSSSNDSVDHESMLMKPGRDRETLRVDGFLRVGRFEIPDANDAIAAKGHIRDPRLAARAVVERAAFDHDVEGRRRRRFFLALGKRR